MDEDIVNNINKYYNTSKKIAGNDGKELLHHILVSFENKRNLKGEELFLYIRRIMINEYCNSASTFHKLHDVQKFSENIDDSENYLDVEQLMDILDNIPNKEAVEIFKRCYFVSDVKTVSEELNLSRMTMYRNYITFVKEEIKKQYVRT